MNLTISPYNATKLNNLGRCAFNGCVNLQNVEIPSTVQTLGDSVFDSCTSLDYVRFRSSSATQLPAQAFCLCSALETVLFENSLASVGDRAFYDCDSLNEAELPETIEAIGEHAFACCDSLQKIIIPARATEISDTAFEGSDNVTIYCYYDSSAYEYARQKHIPYLLMDNARLGDGFVNINDVTAIQRHLAALDTLDGVSLYAADTNQDGELDISDATNLQVFLAEYKIQNPIGEIMTQ